VRPKPSTPVWEEWPEYFRELARLRYRLHFIGRIQNVSPENTVESVSFNDSSGAVGAFTTSASFALSVRGGRIATDSRSVMDARRVERSSRWTEYADPTSLPMPSRPSFRHAMGTAAQLCFLLGERAVVGLRDTTGRERLLLRSNPLRWANAKEANCFSEPLDLTGEQ
jgi:hypothetical protein